MVFLCSFSNRSQKKLYLKGLSLIVQEVDSWYWSCIYKIDIRISRTWTWVDEYIVPLISNITAHFIKVLSTPYSTRENLHTLKWICQSRRQMSILSKGTFLSPYPKPAGRTVALPLFPLQKSLDKVWGSPKAGVLVGGNHLSAPHSSCPLTLIGNVIKTNPDVIYCFPITHTSFFPPSHLACEVHQSDYPGGKFLTQSILKDLYGWRATLPLINNSLIIRSQKKVLALMSY